MVVPMGMPMSGGLASLPDEARSLLQKTKYFVMGMWFFGLLFAIYSPISALSTLCLAIFGTYLLMEDPQMSNCYAIIRRSLVGQCCGTGGMQMLMPFLLLSAINTLVDSMQLIQLFSVYGVATFKFVPIDLLIGIWVCELGSTVLCYRVMKLVLPTMQGPLDAYQQLPNGPPGQQLGFA
ncbi:unnamed protein product [Polarella glacialis]|uniref:Uncharacterized protein n=1 Tax=Polarella glacialis TaxID=89957 RepID=A0A813HAI1_POLGL|nr:unnamed protein product [Polarella glacialis]